MTYPLLIFNGNSLFIEIKPLFLSSITEVWTGLQEICPCDDTDIYCYGCTRQWQWSNNDTISYTDWQIGEPQVERGCWKLTKDGWYRSVCDDQHGFICKRCKF